MNSFMPADESFNGDMEFADLMSDPDAQLLIAQIMDWTQDPNWPDTTRILEILHQYEQILIPYIRDVLKNQDPEWKEWILTYLVAYFPDEYTLVAVNLTEREQRSVIRTKEGEMQITLQESAQMILKG